MNQMSVAMVAIWRGNCAAVIAAPVEPEGGVGVDGGRGGDRGGGSRELLFQAWSLPTHCRVSATSSSLAAGIMPADGRAAVAGYSITLVTHCLNVAVRADARQSWSGKRE